MAAEHDLKPLFRGDTLMVPLWITDKDDNPEDITGQEFSLAIKSMTSDCNEPPLVHVTFPAVQPASLNGEIYLFVEDSETKNFEPGRYYYDIQRIIPGAPRIVQTLMYGRLTIKADIARGISS